MRSAEHPAVPEQVLEEARSLGARIRAARVRRKLRREDLSARSGLSRSTLESIERGDLGAGLGSYLRALWAMGLLGEVSLIADPGLDRDGLALELSAQTKRVRVQRPVDNDF